MAPRIYVVCRNAGEDRIIPRMARALRDALGWSVGAAPFPSAEAIYLSGYFEAQKLKPWPKRPVAAYFTHREEEPPGNAKAKLFDETAKRVQLRIVTCRLYGQMLEQYGPTVQAPAPLERERFTIANRTDGTRRPVVGLSGYTYANHRKGEDLVKGLLASRVAQRVEWRGSGRGWPAAVPTRMYPWAEMPQFYQGLDVLVCPSRVEGIPMPPLEALSCGVRVVVPRGVGLLDELPAVPGIYRYERGDLAGLVQALEQAVESDARVDPQALRAVTEPYSVEAWVETHRAAFAMLLEGSRAAAPAVGEIATNPRPAKAPRKLARVRSADPESAVRPLGPRGIYCVAFGEPARESCLRMMESAKKYMPDIPIALCAAKAIGPEDLLIRQPDSDVGGRRAKLAAYDLAPAEWQSVLYLDADTVVVAPIYQYWQWVEDGWELVICKDPHLMDTLSSFERRNNKAEMDELVHALQTKETLQFNGGVWAFARTERVAAFFHRWQEEWERFAQRDQGALVRALYADPLKVWLLGNEWNTFPKYMKTDRTAGLLHFPGDARRWNGMIPGRIDSPEAWRMVRQFEQQRKGRQRER